MNQMPAWLFESYLETRDFIPNIFKIRRLSNIKDISKYVVLITKIANEITNDETQKLTYLRNLTLFLYSLALNNLSW